jgi:hypothetical protein
MIQQIAVRDDQNAAGTTARVASSASSIVRDVLTLAELQAHLVAADFQEGKRRFVLTGTLLLVGAAALLAGLSAALVALAQGFIALGVRPDALAYLAAAGVGIVLSAAIFALGWKRLHHAAGAFQRSRDEFRNNLECIRAALDATDR